MHFANRFVFKILSTYYLVTLQIECKPKLIAKSLKKCISAFVHKGDLFCSVQKITEHYFTLTHLHSTIFQIHSFPKQKYSLPKNKCKLFHSLTSLRCKSYFDIHGQIISYVMYPFKPVNLQMEINIICPYLTNDDGQY